MRIQCVGGFPAAEISVRSTLMLRRVRDAGILQYSSGILQRRDREQTIGETLQDGLLSLSLPSLLCSPAQHEFAQENRLTVFGWTLDGEVIIELRPCGDSRCGKVVWLKQPLGPEGLPLRDYRNSDPNLRSRPVCGLEVVSGFKKQSDSSWGGGTVYVSDQGTSYSGVAKVLSPTKVEVTGYIGLPIFGASEVWTKVSRPPEICSAKAPSAPSAPSATNSKWTTKVVRAPASRSVPKSKNMKAPSEH